MMLSNRIYPTFMTLMGLNVIGSLRPHFESAIFKNNQSVVVSPLAVHFSLCKLASAAEGETRDALLTALEYKTAELMQNCYVPAQESLSELKRIDFIMFNKVFVNYTKDISSRFYRSKVNYGAEVEPVGFNYPKTAARFINSMLDRITLKRISNVIEGKEIDNETSIMLISGVYFKVTLEYPFDVKKTRKRMFHHENGTRTAVLMMMKTDSFLYLHEPETRVQFVNMRLASFGVTITFGIPRRRRLLRLLDQLQDPQFLVNVHRAMSVTDLKLRVPRFRIKSKLDLTDYVKKIGLHRLFNKSDSGLTDILRKNATAKPMYLSKVKQNCFIDFDELGLFRGAPDNGEAPRRFEEGGIEVMADRPFFFSINLHEDPQHLYYVRPIMSGVYRGPSEGWITII